jgi:hypothetical protein
MAAPTPGTPATAWYSPALLSAVEMILDSQDIPTLVEHREGDSSAMPWARAVLDAATEEVAAREAVARAERDEESDALRTRMANLLSDTADALKGDPGPLRAHDWSDLPRVAAGLMQARAAAEQRGADAALAVFGRMWSDPNWNGQVSLGFAASFAQELHEGLRTDGFPAVGAELSCCADCRQPYTVWYADVDLWNAVMRPNGEQQGEPFLCARCFLVRAEPVSEFAEVTWPQYPSRRDRTRVADLLRQVADLTTERDALRRQVDAVKAHRIAGSGISDRTCGIHCACGAEFDSGTWGEALVEWAAHFDSLAHGGADLDTDERR